MFEPLPRSDLAEADADLNSRDMPFVSVHRSLFRVLLPQYLRAELPRVDVNLKSLGSAGGARETKSSRQEWINQSVTSSGHARAKGRRESLPARNLEEAALVLPCAWAHQAL